MRRTLVLSVRGNECSLPDAEPPPPESGRLQSSASIMAERLSLMSAWYLLDEANPEFILGDDMMDNRKWTVITKTLHGSIEA